MSNFNHNNISTLWSPEFNGTVEYNIVGGNAGKQFSIATDTGTLFLQKQLDFERQSIHQLTVMAYDLAPLAKRLKTFMDITIRVLNVDDNSPQLVMPPLW